MFLFSNAVALINEAIITQKQSVQFPANSLIIRVLKSCFKLNIIANFTLSRSGLTNKNQLRVTVFLRQRVLSQNVVRGVKQISTPTSLVYIKYSNLVRLLNNSSFSLVLISTSKGIMTLQEAVNSRIGGVLLCTIL